MSMHFLYLHHNDQYCQQCILLASDWVFFAYHAILIFFVVLWHFFYFPRYFFICKGLCVLFHRFAPIGERATCIIEFPLVMAISGIKWKSNIQICTSLFRQFTCLSSFTSSHITAKVLKTHNSIHIGLWDWEFQRLFEHFWFIGKVATTYNEITFSEWMNWKKCFVFGR